MVQSEPEVDRRTDIRTWLGGGLLLLGAVLVFGFNLGANSLHNQDEAKHAVVAREAAVDGHWLPLTYNGRPYYNKPPLRIWFTALTFKLSGINAWSVRFWSAASALATVLTLFLLGRRLYGSRAAFIAAVALLTSHQYVYNHCSRSGETDSMLILFLTLGLLSLEWAVVERRRSALWLAAVAIGLGGMTKHLGFLPVALAIAIAWILLARAWRAFPVRTWLGALLLLIVIVLPWHLAMWMVEGNAFLRAYFLREVVERRLLEAAGRQSSARLGPWASIRAFVDGFFPWSYLIPLAALTLPLRAPARRRWLLPLLWLFVILATTVVSVQKFTWYVLPAVPAASLLVGGLIDRFLGGESSPTTRLALLICALAALASTTTAAVLDPFSSMARQSMLGVWTLGRLHRPESAPGAPVLRLLAIAALCCLVYWALGRWRQGRRAHRWARALLITLLMLQALWIVLVPLRFSRQRSPIHEIAELTAEHLRPGDRLHVALAGRKAVNPLFNFYLGPLAPHRLDKWEFDLESVRGALLLTDAATLPALQQQAPDLEAGSRPLGRVGGMLLYRVEPLTPAGR